MHYSYRPEVQLALVSLHMFRHWRDVDGSKLGPMQMAAAPAGLFRIHRRYNTR